MNKIVGVAAVVLSLLTGCPAEKSSDDEDTACTGECLVSRATTGCEEFMSAFCGYFYSCYSGADLAALEDLLGWTDVDSCVSEGVADECSDTRLGEAIRSGRQRFDQGNLDQCLTALDELSCMGLEDFGNHPGIAAACEDVPVGTIATGDACVESDDCAGLDGYCNEDDVCESRSEADYEIECDTPLGADDCPGDTCLTFVPNAQDLTGTCTRHCTDDEECGYGGLCAEIGANYICLSTCLSNSDCSGGLVCRKSGDNVVGLCSVEPL